MIASASLPSAHICSKTSLAILPEIVSSAMRVEQPGEPRARRCATAVTSSAVLVQRGRQLAHHPVRGELLVAGQRQPRLLRSSRPSRGWRSARRRRRPTGRTSRCSAPAFSIRQLRQRRAHGLDECLVERDRQQVRIREVAVVVRFFLGAQRARLALVRIVQARFLADLAAAFDDLDLARDLVVDRLLDEAERIQVLDLAARAELLLRRPGAPRRWRRSGTSLPACCRRRSRGSAPACGSSSGTRPLPSPSACRARRRSPAAACRRDSGRCRSGPGSPRAATCRRLLRGARA